VLAYTGHRGATPRVALLSGGLAVCGICGYPLYTTASHGHRAYGCKAAYMPGRPGYGKACSRILIRAKRFEDDVAERALAWIMKPANARAIDEVQSRTAEPIDSTIGELTASESRLAELGRDYADGLIGRIAFHAAQDRIQHRIDELGRTLAATSVARPLSTLADVSDLVAWWEAASLGQKRALLEQIVASVVVSPHTGRREHYDSARVTVQWR
jgi:site-specific DNA recombinase